jgi:hypothetical protein
MDLRSVVSTGTTSYATARRLGKISVALFV